MLRCGIDKRRPFTAIVKILKIYLRQWFSTEEFLPHGGYLVTSGDIFGCRNLGLPLASSR